MVPCMNATTNPPAQPPELIELVCADGERLVGHYLPPRGAEIGLPVLLAPAIGVKQHFYLQFAQWLAAQGHAVLLFDYRGIGLSLNYRLSDCPATLAEWGQQDQVAALNWLLHRSDADQIVLLGHSAGGQMLGLLPKHRHVARLVGVASSSGWFDGMSPTFALKARLGLQYLLPLGIRLRGYAPCALLGIGENPPAGVARQWAQWCAAGGFARNAVRHRPALDFHAEVRSPTTVFYASDDPITSASTVADLLGTLPNAPSQVIRVEPQAYGLASLGHNAWFRRSHQALWPLLARAVRGQSLAPSP